MNTVNLIVDNEAFTRWEGDWVESLLADFSIRHHIDPGHQLVLENAILVTLMSVKGKENQVEAQLKALRSLGRPAGLIHLSDECGTSPVHFYDQAGFVFRNYHRSELASRANCHTFALGYKTGLAKQLRDIPIARRRFHWTFAGQNKGTRPAMIEVGESIPGGAYYLTDQWDDPNALNLADYGDLLSQSVFVLCPRGNHSLDSFRVWEAMQAGAIPIVEDDRPRPGSAGSYWHLAYGPDFPCPRIFDWKDLRSIMDSIHVETTSETISRWWMQYKSSLRGKMKQVVETVLFDKR